MSNCRSCGKVKENYNVDYNKRNDYYDNQVKTVYSQNAQTYHAAPFPIRRTQYDLNMLQAFCANCGPGFCPTSIQPQPVEPSHFWDHANGATMQTVDKMISADTHNSNFHQMSNMQPKFPMVPY